MEHRLNSFLKKKKLKNSNSKLKLVSSNFSTEKLFTIDAAIWFRQPRIPITLIWVRSRHMHTLWEIPFSAWKHRAVEHSSSNRLPFLPWSPWRLDYRSVQKWTADNGVCGVTKSSTPYGWNFSFSFKSLPGWTFHQHWLVSSGLR